MVFKDYKYGVWKKEIRELLQKRLCLRDKIRYHKKKIQEFEKEQLPIIEKKLNQFLAKAGNKI